MTSSEAILPMPRRAYSYIRFSKTSQARGDSRRRQAAFAAEVCRDEKAVLDESFTLDDLGMSAFRGKNAQVGRLAQFLEAVQTGRVSPGSILILESIDRLSRAKVSEALQLFIRILNAGIIIITAEPRRKYTADSINDIASILEPLIYMSRAHEESQTKSVRVKAAWAQKKKRAAEMKTPISHRCPSWIELTPEGYRLIPERARIVRTIFAWCLEGLGVTRITRALREEPEDYPCFGYQGDWGTEYVRMILTSHAAYGAYQRRTTNAEGKRVLEGEPIPDYYPAAVTEAEWRAAQAAMHGRRQSSGRPGPKETSLFTGIVFEACSRLPMSVKARWNHGKRYSYLRPRRKMGAPAGTEAALPYQPFEDGMLRALGRLRARDVLPEGCRLTELEQRIQTLTTELVALNHHLDQLQAQAAIPNQDPDALPALVKAIGQVTRDKKAKAEVLRTLKEEEATTGRTETLGAFKSLLGILDEVQGTSQEATVRRRIKAAIRQMVESFWVLIQPVDRVRRILHVQLYLRGGQRHYVQVFPHESRGLTPWDLADADFRAGDIGGVAAVALPAEEVR